jgi:glutathione S-transferase
MRGPASSTIHVRVRVHVHVHVQDRSLDDKLKEEITKKLKALLDLYTAQSGEGPYFLGQNISFVRASSFSFKRDSLAHPPYACHAHRLMWPSCPSSAASP